MDAITNPNIYIRNIFLQLEWELVAVSGREFIQKNFLEVSSHIAKPLQPRRLKTPLQAQDATQQQENPSVSEQLARTSRFGYNGLEVPVNAPSFTTPPLVQRQEVLREQENWYQPAVLKRADPVVNRLNLWREQQFGQGETIQRFAETPSGPLTPAQVSAAKAWYVSRRNKYTPDIIKQIQQQVGTEPDGFIGPLTIQAVAKFQEAHQQDNPPLLVDGKAGPRTLPALFPTGLADQEAIDEYVGKAKQVQASWAKLNTPDARGDALLKLVNERLQAASVPPCQKEIKEDLLPTGQFNSETWTIILSQRSFAKSTLTDSEAAEIADIVYHEARHAEQDHRVARMLAGQGKSSAAIQKEMFIRADVADDAASKPFMPGTMDALIAEGWYESQYGAQSAHRIQVLKAARAKKKELKVNEAEEAYNQNPTPENKAKKDAVRQQFEATPEFKAYQDLPEEADAWRVGTEVKNAYLKL